MNLAQQYLDQAKWRHWDEMLARLPLSKADTVLDLGCGPGVVANLLSKRVAQVIGVDANPELIDVACSNAGSNSVFHVGDVTNLNLLTLPKVNGIWSSFTAAYFVDFAPILNHWISCLIANGWIALVEVAGLFTGHHPLPDETADALNRFNHHLCQTGKYGANMGDRLEGLLRSSGMNHIVRTEWDDQELAFHGPASPDVIVAWERRFDRLSAFRTFLGEQKSRKVVNDFIRCISSNDHTCTAKVVMVVARK